jgi:hypothetical protein
MYATRDGWEYSKQESVRTPQVGDTIAIPCDDSEFMESAVLLSFSGDLGTVVNDNETRTLDLTECWLIERTPPAPASKDMHDEAAKLGAMTEGRKGEYRNDLPQRLRDLTRNIGMDPHGLISGAAKEIERLLAILATKETK